MAKSKGSLDATGLSVALSGETGPAGTRQRVRVGRRSALLFTARAASVAQEGGDRSGEGQLTPDPAISDPRGLAPPGAFSAGLMGSQSRPQPIRAQPGGCPGATRTRPLDVEWTTVAEAPERSCTWQRRSGAFALFRKQRRASGWRTQTACFALGARRPSVLLGRRLGSEGSHRVPGGRLPGALGGHPVRTFRGVTPASVNAVLQGSKPRKDRRSLFLSSGASFFQELSGSGRGLPTLGAGSSRVTPGRFERQEGLGAFSVLPAFPPSSTEERGKRTYAPFFRFWWCAGSCRYSTWGTPGR